MAVSTLMRTIGSPLVLLLMVIWSNPVVSSLEQLPTFSTSSDARLLDVVVLDRDRRPVHGLAESDFEVFEDGKLQRTVGATEITIPPPRLDTAEWTREVGTDVASNDVQGRRLVVLVLDDASMDVAHGEPHWVRKIANAAIDELGPLDLAAVVHTYLGRLENFTSDKSKLRFAANSFTPHAWGTAGPPVACMGRKGGCLVSSLLNIADALRYAPIGRKIVIVVTPGLTIPGQNTLRPGTVANTEGLRDMFRAIQDTNTTLYAFDPRGLMTQAFPVPAGAIDLATLTGGRSIQGTNDPHELVPGVFAESRSYYLVGYQVTSIRRDGRFRRLEVRVKQPGVTVRTRRGYIDAPAASSQDARSTPRSLERTINAGVAQPGLAMRATVLPLANPRSRSAEVSVVFEVTVGESRQVVPRPLNLMAVAFDNDWKSRAVRQETLAVSPGAALVRGSLHLQLPPGRYELRLAAEIAGSVGSIIASVEVPDLRRLTAPLMSPLFITTASSSPLRTSSTSMPSVDRVLKIGAAFAAGLRVYTAQPPRSPGPCIPTAQVVDSDGGVVATIPGILLSGDASGALAIADYSFPIPPSDLRDGEYLLTATCAGNKKTPSSSIRFSVLSPAGVGPLQPSL